MTDEETRLAAVAALQLLDTPAEERFDRVTRLCTRLFGVPMAAVTLVDRERTVMLSEQGGLAPEVPREQSFCDTAVRNASLLVVEDLAADTRFSANPLVNAAPGLRFYAGQPLEAPGGAVVGTLCLFDRAPRTFSDADRALLRDLGLWVQKELALDEELSRAAEVQRGLLPAASPHLPGWDLAGACLPSREVGGDLYDWYDVATAQGPRLGLTVADVMGKGMPAAIVMATLRAVLRAGTRTGDPAAAVALGAATMEADFASSGSYATAFHALVDPATGAVEAVDAGHGLALVVRADGSEARSAVRGLPAGALPGTTWQAERLVVGPGDALVVYSDGLLELHADRAAVERQVHEALSGGATAAQAVEHLTWAARRLSLPDDVTVVVLRRDAA